MALAILIVLAAGSNDRCELLAASRWWFASSAANLDYQNRAVLNRSGPLCWAATRRVEAFPGSGRLSNRLKVI